MLELSEVDLELLATALEDHSPFGSSWWIADDDLGEVPAAEAERAVADARITVDAIEGWLSGGV